MWVVFSVFLVLWLLGINFYMPAWLVIALFGAMLTAAALAALPARQRSRIG